LQNSENFILSDELLASHEELSCLELLGELLFLMFNAWSFTDYWYSDDGVTDIYNWL